MTAANPVAAQLDGAIVDIASQLECGVTEPGDWFDGFWDFYVPNRDRMKRGSAWEVTGRKGPWALEMFASDDPRYPLFEAYVFVEAKDRRPGGAPWPVSSIVIGDDSPVRTGAPDRFERPHDLALAERIRDAGFVPRIGYWGVRCDAEVPRDAPDGMARVQRLLAVLPEVMRVARALADDLWARRPGG